MILLNYNLNQVIFHYSVNTYTHSWLMNVCQNCHNIYTHTYLSIVCSLIGNDFASFSNDKKEFFISK